MAAPRRKFDGDGKFDVPEPKKKKTLHEKDQEKRLIVVLEKASLEAVKNGKSYELLNCDKHKGLMRKHNKDPSLCRPDIAHQCLLMLFDSPLNRAGLLQVYVHTENNVLIEIHPQTRIPRTFERFAGLMVQLLHKFSIRASDGPNKLLKVIKNPVTDHLPTGCTKIGMSFHADSVVNPRDLVPADKPIVLVIGAMAHGSVDSDYIEKSLSISNYPLSGALTCAKVCSAFEEVWGVV
ncbi:ribosomal RNA small subunit methyltransferase NEP1-like [Branchiostoma floridae]|uniref:18S rRNA (pseudouridine(1248)-N1)-methyltransferase n=1 Tax=Branchiostoma floridae TaxID=7739 RepID=A0A9J7M152_BRAFL|nr:ribosomal RNA small subunit methyltransferase NEP1-like [Branchiostoma floridae]